MASITALPLPPGALLQRYAGDGGYADCYAAEVAGDISLPRFIEAFYSSAVFKLELIGVGLLFKRPWSNALAGELARGETATFSAWRVEGRDDRQILMWETISNKTRSWLLAEPLDGPSPVTRLYFGTAVLPVGRRADGRPRMSLLFALIWFHKLYARALLAGGVERLARMKE